MDRLVAFRRDRWKEYGSFYAREHEKNLENWELGEVVHLLKPQKGERILDLGCNTGEFCHLLKSRFSSSPKGIDINRDAIQIAKTKYPSIPFEVKDISQLKEKEEYDGITMIEVIEHLPDPVETLKKAKTLLKREGRLVLSTPNQWAYPFKIKSLIVGTNLSYDPLHLHEYNPLTLRTLLQKSGLKVERIYTKVLGIPLLRHLSSPLYFHLPSGYWGRFLFCLSRREDR